jgi:molecular chaperone DnaK
MLGGYIVMVLGIDLGTTFSAGAYVDDAGEPQIAINSESQRLTPSVVFFDEDGSIIVGDVAKENTILYPEEVVSKVKIDMGKRKIFKIIDDINYTPEVISSLIIKKIVQDASACTGEKIDDVVITVPAYFMDSQRKATEDAARLAGVNLLTIIDEPTAAALYYTSKNKLDKANILIYDFGGGTFDVTILEIDDDMIHVKNKAGLSKAGGTMFDQYLVDYVCNYFNDKYGIDLEDDEYLEEYQYLFKQAEECKKQLSTRTAVTISMKVGSVKEKISITRELFESMIAGIFNQTVSKVKETIRNAGMTIQQIDKVLLVGGSSKIPYVYEQLTELFGKAPSKEINPNEAVALGAALYASIYRKNTELGKKSFTDVSSHSIGFLVYVNETQQENHIAIPRMTNIPCEMEQICYTKINSQRQINLCITEGEYKEMDFISVIGEFLIDLPVGLPINTEVKIKISLDERQLIHVWICIPEANLEKEYDIKRNANLNEEEIENLRGIMIQKIVI